MLKANHVCCKFNFRDDMSAKKQSEKIKKYIYFIDLENEFDWIHREDIGKHLKNSGIEVEKIEVIKLVCEDKGNTVSK